MVYPIAGITAIAAEKFAFTKTISQPWIHAALIALLYPLGWFLLHASEAFELYGQGRTLPVFMDTDHVRFSIFLCSAMFFTLLPVSNARYKKYHLLFYWVQFFFYLLEQVGSLRLSSLLVMEYII